MEKMIWGQEPALSGPRDWFRNSLIIREVVKHCREGKVLDYGAGSGNLLTRLSKKNYVCVGMDQSSLVVNNINTLSKMNKLHIHALQGDEKTLSRIKDKYDVIVSGETLEHLKNPESVIKNFYKMLNSGGVCVVSVPAHMGLWDINDDFSSHYRRYEISTLSQPFLQAGFKVTNVFYWGFPLSLFWHRMVYLPLVENKIRHKTNYSHSPGLFNKILNNNYLKRIFSYIFYFDNLLNWTRLGGGLILTAVK